MSDQIKTNKSQKIVKKEISPQTAQKPDEEIFGAQVPVQHFIASGDDPRDSQVNLLSDRRFLTAQRQALATRVGKNQGTRHLQRVMELVSRRLSRTTSNLLQRQEAAGESTPAEEGQIPTMAEGFAPVGIGRVTAVKGVASIDNPAVIEKNVCTAIYPSSYQLQEGDEIYEGSEIWTGKKSGIKISLSDGSTITLSSLTRIIVSTGSPTSGGGGVRSKLHAWIARLVAGGEGSFTVETSNAVAGVRG